MKNHISKLQSKSNLKLTSRDYDLKYMNEVDKKGGDASLIGT